MQTGRRLLSASGFSAAAVPRGPRGRSASSARCWPTAAGEDAGARLAPAAAAPAAHPPQHKTKAREEEIAQRIAASRLRRASLPAPLKCPACAVGLGSAQGLLQHMSSCCADLLLGSEAKWQQALSLERSAASAAAHSLVSGLLQQEHELRQEAIRLTFRSGELHGASQQPVRLTCAEVARRMQLPESRVSQLVQRGMRAYPMPADPEPVEVLYEDDHLLAAQKPPGLNTAPVHRFRGGSMVNRLIGYLGRPPYVLHRLDMDTSGLLLFAKTPQAVKLVAEQFRARTVSKWYLALCIGVPRATHFHVHTRVARHPSIAVARINLPPLDPALQPPSSPPAAARSSSSTDLRQVAAGSEARQSAAANVGRSCSSNSSGDSQQHEPVSVDLLGQEFEEGSLSDDADVEDAKHAVTQCVVVSVNPDVDLMPEAQHGLLFDPSHAARGACLIACSPHTGRTHQIRLHCQHLGHPLVGDELYGVKGPWIGRQGLHAAALLVRHPKTGLPLLLGAALPQDMQQAVQQLGLQVPEVMDLPEMFENSMGEKCAP